MGNLQKQTQSWVRALKKFLEKPFACQVTLSVCIVPGTWNKAHAMTFSHLLLVHFLFLRSSTVLQVLIFFSPVCLCSFCLTAMACLTGFPWPPSSPPSPLPAFKSCLSLHVAAGLLTVSEAGTHWSSCSSSPAPVQAWRHHGEARVSCAAWHVLALEHCSAPLGLSHWGRKSLTAPWLSLFSSAPGAGAEMACCLSHYWKVAVVYWYEQGLSVLLRLK